MSFPSPAPHRTDGDAAAARGRRRADALPGSLGRAAGFTTLTTVAPGSGLIPTRLRRPGIVLLTAVVGVVVGLLLWWVISPDPLRTLLRLATSRTVLLSLFAAVIVAGLIWVGQVLLANTVLNTRERLRGRRKAVSVGLAIVLMIAAAAPFTVAANNLWSAQGLLGNQSVFGGKGSGRLGAGADPWAGVDRVNVMLLGQDAGPDRTGTRPDTIMVASIDAKTGRTALFSIPRNVQYVRFPKGTPEAKAFPKGFDAFGRNENLINAVWQWAEEHKSLFPGDKNPGLTATRHAVEETMGLKMDYYGMVDLKGFEDLVNAMGGVSLDVERKIPIGGGTNQSTGGKYPITGWIKPGEQKLDGYHALWYARSREGSDDYNRMCRQQRMVRAVSEQANPAKLALAFPSLVSATEENIETDIPSEHLNAFVDLALRVKDTGFKSYPITRDVDKPGSKTWQRGGHPDWAYLHSWVQASIKDSMKDVQKVEKVSTPSSKPSAKSTATSSGSASTSSTPSPSESESPSASSTPSTTPASTAPVIDEDPLKSCMPGASQG